MIDKRFEYSKAIESELQKGVKHNKRTIEKLAESFDIYNKNLVKEMTELSIVNIARKISALENLSNYQKFQNIVGLYQNQVNLSHRTSQSMMFQQYSTPAPISYIASLYVMQNENLSGFSINAIGSVKRGGRFTKNHFSIKSDKKTAYTIFTENQKGNKGIELHLYFEPSAGNGLLTIALPYEQTIVNEVDDVRLENLKSQPFKKIMNQDATMPFIDYYKHFDGIVTNPPFGSLMEEVKYDGFPIKKLDFLMALRTLDTMKNDGKGAIIVGGHTTFDEVGRIQAGQNRIFYNYLYSHYNVEDIINISGQKLYSRQGTAFDVRLILINGRKEKIEGFAPLKNELLSEVVSDFDRLYERVFGNKESDKKTETKQTPTQETDTDRERKIKIAKAKIRLLKLPTLNTTPGPKAILPTAETKSTNVIDMNINFINIDRQRFQNRIDAFSNESKDRIVNAVKNNTFDWIKFDAITIWFDKKNKKYYVLAGHSRLSAFQQLNKEKYKMNGFDFSTIPAKIFEGTEQQAIELALNSNILSTKETDVERALYYAKQRQICEIEKGLAGRNECDRQVEELIKQQEGKNYNFIANMSYLNPDGYLMQNLKAFGMDKDNENINTLRTISSWIGEAIRKGYIVTPMQENEVAKFLAEKGYGTKKHQFSNKMMFLDRLKYAYDKWVDAGSDTNKLLNIESAIYKNSVENEYDKQITEAKQKYDDAQKEHSEKYNTYLNAVLDGKIDQDRMNELMTPLTLYLNRTKAEYERLKGKKNEIKEAIKSQQSLFGTPYYLKKCCANCKNCIKYGYPKIEHHCSIYPYLYIEDKIYKTPPKCKQKDFNRKYLEK